MRGFTLVELLVVVVIIGLLAAIAIANYLDAMHRARQKSTMADLKVAGEGAEMYNIDFNFLPQGDFAQLRQLLLVLGYIKPIPVNDHWNHPYEYQVAKDSSSYSLISRGKDGAVTDCPDQFTDFDCDIVYSNGIFVRSPAK